MRILIPNQVYRRQELHDWFGGQRQGGISTPRKWPVIFLFSSPRGHEFGYQDGWREDGFYIYTGEGQVGDMRLTRGNKAIVNHMKDGKELHLFEQVERGQVRYVRPMVYITHEWAEGPDGRGQNRKIVRFLLAPLPMYAERAMGMEELITPGESERARFIEETAQGTDLIVLRERALYQAQERPTDPRETRRRIWLRSKAVRRYALQRANGCCEACGNPAPFRTPEGEPFLEVHHIHRLADGGPDHPARIAAICPNCHRRAHYAKDADSFNQWLAQQIQAKERAIQLTVS